MKNKSTSSLDNLVSDIKSIVRTCRAQAAASLNLIIIREHWEVGRRIVVEDQNGQLRAQYGSNLLKILSQQLNAELGKGYSPRSLSDFRQFYLQNPDWEILHPRVQNLTWSHFKILLRENNKSAREWYLNEATKQMWSKRTLDRNVGSQYYHRLLSSPSKAEVISEMERLTSPLNDSDTNPEDFIKSPIVTEFLGLSKDCSYTETSLESALISHLQQFLMELGKGYAFVERQQHIVTDTDDYFIDLVFYNYLMKCFVLIDLKTTKITHQDVGQMDMYVRMYDDLKCTPGDNPTIGILLCAETSEDIARYSILNGNKQLFASKYLTYLPDGEELLKEIDRQKEIYQLQHNSKK